MWTGSVFGMNDVYKRVHTFIMNLKSYALQTGHQPELFFASVDITKWVFTEISSYVHIGTINWDRSFDSIDQKKLFSIVENEVMKKNEYLIIRYSITAPSGVQKKWVFYSLWKW